MRRSPAPSRIADPTLARPPVAVLLSSLIPAIRLPAMPDTLTAISARRWSRPKATWDGLNMTCLRGPIQQRV